MCLLEISEGQVKCQRSTTEDARPVSLEADTHWWRLKHHEYRKPILSRPRRHTAALRVKQPSQRHVLLSLPLTGTAASSSWSEGCCNLVPEATSQPRCRALGSPMRSNATAQKCSGRGGMPGTGGWVHGG